MLARLPDRREQLGVRLDLRRRERRGAARVALAELLGQIASGTSPRRSLTAI